MTINPLAVTATETLQAELGELIAAFYDAALEEVGDEDLAELIASTMINELLIAAVPRTASTRRAA